MLFSCHNYSEHKKMQLAIVEFKDYALVWWSQGQARLISDKYITPYTLDEWNEVMRTRFMPKNYHEDLIQHIYFLTQGFKTVEDYYKEMEMLMRANFREEEDSDKYRFLKGLRREIKEKREMYPFSSTAELVQLAIKVRSHLKTTSKFKSFKSSNFQNRSKPW